MTRLPLRIGTRGSQLALAQAQQVQHKLSSLLQLPPEATQIVKITTSGDVILDRPLSEVGGKGLFTKEIETALLANEIDIAVHSAKDMATQLPQGLEIAAVLEREDPRDVFISTKTNSLDQLPQSATIGSSSLRRRAMIAQLRPDLQQVEFRGNVNTRLAKLEQGVADGTLLALAGLKRLNLAHLATEIFDLTRFLPAPAQGAICLQIRQDDEQVRQSLAALNHKVTAAEIACERAFLAALDGSCRMPIAGLARVEESCLRFNGMVLKIDGSEKIEADITGHAEEAEALGRQAGLSIRSKMPDDFFVS